MLFFDIHIVSIVSSVSAQKLKCSSLARLGIFIAWLITTNYIYLILLNQEQVMMIDGGCTVSFKFEHWYLLYIEIINLAKKKFFWKLMTLKVIFLQCVTENYFRQQSIWVCSWTIFVKYFKNESISLQNQTIHHLKS